MENLQELFNTLYGSDLESLKIITREFIELKSKDYIEFSGFNTNTGYVYIALESGVTIASCFGQAPDFIVTDYDDGTEYFEDSYEDALNVLEKLHSKN